MKHFYRRLNLLVLFIVIYSSLFVHHAYSRDVQSPIESFTISNEPAAPPRPAGHCNSDPVALGINPTSTIPPLIAEPVPESFWTNWNLPTPKGHPAWRMIRVEGGHAVIMFTEDRTLYPDHAIQEHDPQASHFTPFGNSDENQNAIPDYAERVLSCLDESYNRYLSYYGLSDFEKSLLTWMYVTYEQPSGQWNNQNIYPVFIQLPPPKHAKAFVEPWIYRNLVSSINCLGCSYMSLPLDFARETGGWLYPPYGKYDLS